MAAGSRLAAILIAAVASAASAQAADICEGCWEVGGRGAVLFPSSESSLDATPGIGAFGLFHFRPYWSVQFGLDRHPGSIDEGPDETLTFFMVRGAYTFRSAREQRTRPFMYFGAGVVFDQIGTEERSLSTPAGLITARAPADSDSGLAYSFGVGGHSALGKKTWLRFEGQWITWSSFGGSEDGFRVLAALTYRLGR